MRAFKTIILSVQLAASLALAGAAMADDVISVVWRKAQFLPIKGDPASIIIGDPNVTDVSIEGPGKILIFGKVPGETSLMVLDANGDLLINAAVVVTPESARHVSIISPSESAYTERTWNCYGRCVQVIGPGSIEYKAPKRAAGSAGAVPGMTAAAEETAGGVQSMNQGVSDGAKAVGGQSDLLVTP